MIEQSRTQLIQRATTRLRRRLLEERLNEFMQQLTEYQESLEAIRAETSTTIVNMNNMIEDSTDEGVEMMNRYMDIFEDKLESHKFDFIQSIPSSNVPSTSVSSEKETLVSRESLKKKERRKRVKNQRRRYQESVISYPSDECSSYCTPSDDWNQRAVCTTDQEDDPFYDLAGNCSFRAGSFCGSVYDDSQQPQKAHHNFSEFAWKRRQRRKDFSASIQNISDSVSYHHPLSSIQFSESDSHYLYDNYLVKRNVLDEAESFLGKVEADDDGGFCQDLYLLLKNPDLCRRPFSEIEATMHELRQKEGYNTRPVHSLLYKLTFSALQWCRFLSILSAAVVISVLKGPEDLCQLSISH